MSLTDSLKYNIFKFEINISTNKQDAVAQSVIGHFCSP